MGDALGAIFGGGDRTSQSTQADPTSQSLNRMREEQLGTLFSGAGNAPFWSFGQSGGDAYTPSEDVNKLFQTAMSALSGGSDNQAGGTADLGGFNFDQYKNLGYNRDLYNQGQSNLDRDFYTARASQAESLDRANAAADDAYNKGTSRVDSDRANALTDINNVYSQGLSQRDADVSTASAAINNWYNQAGQANEANVQQALARSDRNFRGLEGDTARNLQDALSRSQSNYANAIDQSKGYISQIATPQIMQQMVLQGLEGGGAVPAAIAQASAQVGTPLASQFMAEQTGLSQADMANMAALRQQYMQGQGDISQADIATQAALGQQALGESSALGRAGLEAGTALGRDRLSSVTDVDTSAMGLAANLAQGLQSARTSLSQSDMNALSNLMDTIMQGRTALSSQQMGNEASFTQSLPSAADTFSQIPGKQRLLNAQAGATTAQAAGSLFNLADYSRQLKESDLLRRQGVASTGFTGIPYTPGSTTNKRDSQQPLFNFFGQG